MPVAVSIGSNDDTNTEMLAGPLHEGQRLIVGVASSRTRTGFWGLRIGF